MVVVAEVRSEAIAASTAASEVGTWVGVGAAAGLGESGQLAEVGEGVSGRLVSVGQGASGLPVGASQSVSMNVSGETPRGLYHTKDCETASWRASSFEIVC